MFIKSILLGSVAAVLSVPAAYAADAIVAAAPEPAEYVRVCDAFGTGYFYIPGTETCLKFGGEIRADVDLTKNSNGKYTWSDEVRTRLNIDTKTDSEIGAIGTGIQIQSNYTSGNGDKLKARQAYITAGGFTAGRFAGYSDDPGLPGESGTFFNNTVFTSLAYNYKADAFEAGLRVDDLRDSLSDTSIPSGRARNVGLQAELLGSIGSATLSGYGFYDFSVDKGGFLGQAVVKNVGPGTINFIVGYANGDNAYTAGKVDDYDTGKWDIAGSYTLNVTDKLAITPEIAYYDQYRFSSGHALQGDLYTTYDFAKGLTGAVDVKYTSVANGNEYHDENSGWSGYLRLTRKF